MPDFNNIEFLTGKFLVFALFFIRTTAMMFSAPFFGTRALPSLAKIWIALFISFIITSAYWEDQPQIDLHLWNLVWLVFKEIMVGMAIGFATNLVFHAARFAGGLIDFDMGYRTSVLFNQDVNTPTLAGELKSLVVLMLFIFLNGHHFLVEALFVSVRAVPISAFEVTGSTTELLIRYATTVLIIGIKMAAPVLIALFLTNLSLALLARVAPQTNIFILSFTFKVAIGLLVMMGSVPVFVMIAKYSLQIFESETLKIIMSLNPGRV